MVEETKPKMIMTMIGGTNKDKIGGNCHVLEYTDEKGQTTRIMFDLGSVLTPYETGFIAAYPDVREYFDFIDPETKKLHKAEKPVSALFITHKHDDHNGALVNYAKMGYVIPQIYTGKSTKNFIRLWNNAEGVMLSSEPKALKNGDIVKFGDDFEVEACSMSHSTSDPLGFRTRVVKNGKIEAELNNNGDFKTDYVPIGDCFNEKTYFEGLEKRKPHFAVFSLDSTGAIPSGLKNIGFEKNVDNVKSVIETHPDKDLFICPVIARSDENMAVIVAAARAVGGKVMLDGHALSLVVNSDRLSGYDYFDDVLYHGSMESFLLDKSIKVKIVICTGGLAQGLEEYMENRGVSETSPIALSSAVKMALGVHPSVRIGKNAAVLLSQRIIEQIDGKSGPQMLQLFAKQGASIFMTPCGVHISNFEEIQMGDSGHATADNLSEFMKQVKEVIPNVVVLPIHGSPEQCLAMRDLMASVGIETYLSSNLDRFEISADGIHSLPSEKKSLYWLGMRMVFPNPFDKREIPLEGIKEIMLLNENYEPVEKICEILNARRSTATSGRAGKQINTEAMNELPTSEKISPLSHKQSDRKFKKGRVKCTLKSVGNKFLKNKGIKSR